jgi:conjugative relaxase-like TrwC/TraI family protein
MLAVVDLRAGRAEYYLARSKLEYLQGDHADGIYYGQGAAALGLSGHVRGEDFRSLFQGYLHGKKFVRSAGTEKHYPGVDLCFAAPGSVNCFWAVSDPPTRALIEECQLRAVKKALSYLESETRVRVGRGGSESLPAGIVATLWMHGASRAEDPNLHHHGTLFNVGVPSDGKPRTLCAEIYFMHKMAAGAIYRAELAKLLEHELGVTVYRPTQKIGNREEKKSWFEIKGVPEEQMEQWSTRSKEIQEYARERGLEGAQGKQIATLATRQPKKATPMKKLFSRWRQEAAQHGFTQDSVPRGKIPDRDHEKETTEAVSIALKNVTRRSSHFAKRDLLKEVAVEGQGRGLGSDQVISATEVALEHSPEVIRLGTLKREPRFTTKEVLQLEKALLSRMEASKGKNAHRLKESTVLRAILETQHEASVKDGRKVELSEEQVAAVNRLARGEDQIAVISGGFGTGKELAARVAKRAFEIEKYRCIEAGKTLSVSRILRDLELGVLDEAKHHAKQLGRTFASSVRNDFRRTVTGKVVGALAKHTPLGRVLPKPGKPYPFDPVTIDRNTVLIVHRAEAVSVKQMEELTRKVMERGAKLCLIGDTNAPPPLERVSTFAPLSRTLGTARLTRNFRQGKQDQAALESLTRGEGKEALKSFADRGVLHVAGSQTDALRQMISDWQRNDGTRKPMENLLVVSADKRLEANRLAQDEMKRAGKLGRKKVSTGAEEIAVGDRVALTKRATYLGIQAGGETGRVIRIGRRQLTRETFKGKQFRSLWSLLKYAEKVKRGDKNTYVSIETDSGQVVTVPLERYGKENIRLAYAVSHQEARERSADNVFLLTGSTTSREQLASLLSRGRETQVYTDRQSAGDKLTTLARNASRSEVKEMAHDILEQNQHNNLEIQR